MRIFDRRHLVSQDEYSPLALVLPGALTPVDRMSEPILPVFQELNYSVIGYNYDVSHVETVVPQIAEDIGELLAERWWRKAPTVIVGAYSGGAVAARVIDRLQREVGWCRDVSVFLIDIPAALFRPASPTWRDVVREWCSPSPSIPELVGSVNRVTVFTSQEDVEAYLTHVSSVVRTPSLRWGSLEVKTGWTPALRAELKKLSPQNLRS